MNRALNGPKYKGLVQHAMLSPLLQTHCRHCAQKKRVSLPYPPHVPRSHFPESQVVPRFSSFFPNLFPCSWGQLEDWTRPGGGTFSIWHFSFLGSPFISPKKHTHKKHWYWQNWKEKTPLRPAGKWDWFYKSKRWRIWWIRFYRMTRTSIFWGSC